jgi:uncharacterized glyoxalase superfamily protein PhnB
MRGTVKGVPEGSSVVIPRLYCRSAEDEIYFCKEAFGAAELNRRPGPDGKAAHALLTIRGEMIMIEAEWAGLPSRPPAPDGTSPVVMFVHVENVDSTVERAVTLGASTGSPASRRENPESDREPVLGRPQRLDYGSRWSRMDSRHPHPRNTRRTEEGPLGQHHGEVGSAEGSRGRLVKGRHKDAISRPRPKSPGCQRIGRHLVSGRESQSSAANYCS